MADIEIEIDGKKLTAKPNQMVIEVADAAGIYIPRFCYHKHLSIAANCRMCLVEVEKSPKTLPACATPVMQGMKIFTQSPKTIEAQRAVMEFLLINHPLDCPICDQGGECELQDIAMGYGSDWSHYDETKRAVEDENLGSLVATEMTRCILCTRCVRFGTEVAGLRELGVTQRGGHAEIKTFVQQHALRSEVSGNIIDLCPVGALTSKPYRFTARPWELKQSAAIAPHDCLGSHINVHTLTGKVMRVVSRECKAVNQTWISDRDRFSYAGLNHADRLGEPLMRVQGKLQPVDWQTALNAAATRIHDNIKRSGINQYGVLAHQSATIEEYYLLQKIARALGIVNIDHRLREQDMRDDADMPLFPGMQASLDALEESDAILLIGSHLTHEQPIAGLRVRQAVTKHQAMVAAINPMDYDFNFPLAAKEIVAPHQLPSALMQLVSAIEKNNDHPIAVALHEKKRVAIIVGSLAIHHSEAAVIRALAQKIATLTGGTLSLMTDGANSSGAWLAGFVPHRHAAGSDANLSGVNAYDMLATPLKNYLLLNVEPDLDCANSADAIAAIKQAESVIAFSTYLNPIVAAKADIIFPIAAFTETSGTFVNARGEWQSFTGCAKAFENARPAWKVFRVLANFLHIDGFNYESSEEVRDELKALLATVDQLPGAIKAGTLTAKDQTQNQTLSRIGEIPIYAGDAIVRRSEPLHFAQTAMNGEVATARLHSKTARLLGIEDGDFVKVTQATSHVTLIAVIDERVPQQAVWVAGGIAQTVGLHDLFGLVQLQKVSA